MKKKQFDLQQIQFTQQSDDEKNFPNELFQMYNKQYSLVLNQTKNFFADVIIKSSQCKDFFTRFITLNNMGIGFNLPLMLSTMLGMQGELMSPKKNRLQAESWQTKKEKFQAKFVKIVKKMGQVIQQLLNLEVKIKTTYLGQAFDTPNKVKSRINPAKYIKMPKNKNIQKQKSHSRKKNEDILIQQQNNLRALLQKGMTPYTDQKPVVCDKKHSPPENIDKLTNKIQKLKSQIQASRTKQEKIWKIFNQKRPSRNMFQQQVPIHQSQQIKQYKKMNDILSDIISQKNRYLSSYQTVQNSII